MDVVHPCDELIAISHSSGRESALPNRGCGVDAVGISALDERYRTLDRDA
jgi:hypothetical protein